MIINAKEFKPAVKGQSDKFSWNLYRVLKEYEGVDLTVYKFGWEPCNGVCTPEDGQLLLSIGGREIGIAGSIVGITSRGPKAVTCCISWSKIPFDQIEKKDVTEWFFREYSRIGRCLFQPEWSHEFVSINKNSRKCIYCQTIQTRTINTIKKIIRRDEWK